MNRDRLVVFEINSCWFSISVTEDIGFHRFWNFLSLRYSSIYYLGAHSKLTKSLLVTLVACEQLTSMLSPSRIISTLLFFSLLFKFLRFSCVLNVYVPKKCSIIFNGSTTDGFGTFGGCKPSHPNNQCSNGEVYPTLLISIKLVFLYSSKYCKGH